MTKQFISELKQMKDNNKPISVLTAYDVVTAQCLAESGIDLILVGDSVGNVFSGYDTTIPVTLEDMIYHGKAVRRGAPKSIIVIDMPFMSYRVNLADSKKNAARLMRETGANAVKCEINSNHDIDTVRELVLAGIPVMGHIGLTPQFVEQFGGFKKQGKSLQEQTVLLEQAKQLELCGAFAVVLEVIPDDLASSITKAITIPTIGIGAGKDCDGQVLVINDLVGFNANKAPSFAKQYDNFYDKMKKAVSLFKKDVDKKSL